MPLVKTRRPLIGASLAEGVNGELVWKGNIIGNNLVPGASVLWADAPAPSTHPAGYYEIFDDFIYQASATASEVMTWTSMDDGSTGTNAFSSTLAGGWYSIVTAAAQDDYHGIRAVAKNFIFAAGKKVWLEARYSLTEAATNKAAIFIGLTDTVTTGGLQTGTSGPLASFTGIAMYKNEGSMLLNGIVSNVSAQTTVTAMATQVTATNTRVGFHWDGSATVSFYTDVGSTGSTGWTLGGVASLAALTAPMYLVATVKAGAGGSAETLAMDYLRCVQLR